MRSTIYSAHSPSRIERGGRVLQSLPSCLAWAFAFLLILGAGTASGQITDVVSRFSFPLTSGGGKSSGRHYKVSSTIGQPGTGKSSGGGYNVKGGFQSVMGLCQTTGAPTLRIVHLDQHGATLGWPASPAGWVLQETAELASDPHDIVWARVTMTPVLVGEEYRVSFNPTVGTRFYRLIYP